MTRLSVCLSFGAAVTGLLAVVAPAIGQEAAKAPVFDAVSIKPYKSEGGGMMRTRIQTLGDGYSASGVSVKTLIQNAYNLKMEDQISGVTGSMSDARFDVAAKVDAEGVAELKKLSSDESNAQRRLMMQAMLADRFKLKVHHETKELPMYSLVIAKGGFKRKEADPNDTYPNGVKGPDGAAHSGMMMFLNGVLKAQGVPISNLANSLSLQVHRLVVDKTGLTGKYDFSLAWTADGVTPDNGWGTETWPSLFTALQEQLGLKLEPTKGMVDTIVVDHVEMPSEN